MKIKDLFNKSNVKELNETIETTLPNFNTEQINFGQEENEDPEKSSSDTSKSCDSDDDNHTPSLKNKKQNEFSMKNNEQHYIGHRSRLKKQLLEHGATTFKDYELLELLLTFSIPRSDTKPLAKKLLNEFKYFKQIFSADKHQLAQIKGMGESTICFFEAISEVCARLALEDIIDEVLLNSPEKVINYCKLRMSGLKHEQFRVLFLNRKNKLICDETVQNGTIDKAAVFPRELVKRALEIGAGAIILVHNHPSGDPTPSKADVETTLNIQKAADLMEIFLYDHIIIGKNRHYSMRSHNILG